MSELRICVIGDIIGKPGRLAVMHALPDLREELDIGMVIANGENTAAGAGLTPSLADELLAGGIDVMIIAVNGLMVTAIPTIIGVSAR